MSKSRLSAHVANRRTGVKLGLVAMCMFAFGYALVPLYDVLCEVTGLNGKTARAEASSSARVDAGRWVLVEFTGQTMNGLPWEFRPLQKTLRVHPGETAVAWYEARNIADEPVTGQAVPSLAPNRAASYFKKIECFCFTQQQLAARESRRMPVRFTVDPALPGDVGTVTLAYSFFNSDAVSARKYGGVPGESQGVATHDHRQHGAPAPAGG